MFYVGVISSQRIQEAFLTRVRSAIEPSLQESESLSKNNLTLFYGKQNTLNDFDEILVNDRWIVLGRIFDRKTFEPCHQEQFQKTHIQNLDAFNAKYWGKYVVIQQDIERNQTFFARDVSGQLPVFYLKEEDGTLIFSSNVEYLAKITRQTLSPTIEAMTSFVHLIRVFSTNVFESVHEIQTEKCLSVNKHNETAILDAKMIGVVDTPKDNQSSTPLSDLLLSSIRAWIKPYQNIYLSYSGGLDSTALLFYLKEAVSDSQHLEAVHLYHPDFNEACEGGYADKGAIENNVQLTKVSLKDYLPFSPRQTPLALLPNKPCLAMMGFGMQEASYQAMDSSAPSMMLTGQGGDHALLCPPPKASIIDCLTANQFGIIPKKLHQLAHFYRQPIFEILKTNIKALKNAFNHDKLIDDLCFYQIDKPWFKGIDPTLEAQIIRNYGQRLLEYNAPGKKEHIHQLIAGLNTIEQVWIDTANPCFYPFLSQPFLDHAARLNTFDLYDKGYDRHIIRKEVADRYKTDLVWRRDKGATTGATLKGFKHNLDHIKALCLEGFFAQNNLVNKDALLKCILSSANGYHEHMTGLAHLIAAEMFIDSWRTKMSCHRFKISGE